jgi:hypothetical protein
MEVSGQLHAPAALPPGERAPDTHCCFYSSILSVILGRFITCLTSILNVHYTQHLIFMKLAMNIMPSEVIESWQITRIEFPERTEENQDIQNHKCYALTTRIFDIVNTTD